MEITKLEGMSPIEINEFPLPPHGHVLQAVFKFDNGYGASVILGKRTYGVELAVLIFNPDDSYSLTYDTPVTSDVVGWVETEAELLRLLRDIQRLSDAPTNTIHGRYDTKRLT